MEHEMKFKSKGTIMTAYQMLEMSRMQPWMQLSHHLTLHNFLEKYQRIGKQTKDSIKNNKDTYNGKSRGQNRSYINFKSP